MCFLTLSLYVHMACCNGSTRMRFLLLFVPSVNRGLVPNTESTCESGRHQQFFLGGDAPLEKRGNFFKKKKDRKEAAKLSGGVYCEILENQVEAI